MWRSARYGFLVIGIMGMVSGWGQSSPMRVSGGVMAGQIMERTDPIYPPIARAAGVSGAVVLRAIIDETGHAMSLQVVSGPEMLRAAALQAVRTWVYKPYLLNGVATSVDTVVTVNFQIPTVASAKPAFDSPVSGAPPAQDQPPSQTADFCGTPKISHQVMQSYLSKRVDPIYPKLTEASGLVVIRICLNKDGAVDKEEVVSGPEALRGAATSAVRQWVFRPYSIEGMPAAVNTTVTVMFFPR